MSDDEKVLVITSRVKQYVADKGYRFGSAAVEQLSKEVKYILNRAILRCENNGRKTVQGQDI